MKRVVILGVVLVVSMVSLLNANAMDATLAWDANTEEDLAGYRIFHRQEDQGYNYGNPSWEGTDTTCTISGLLDNITYYFVARAFDTSGNESPNSNEVSCVNTNVAPVMDPIDPKTVKEGQLLEFTVTATDSDGDNLTYAAANLPSGAEFDAVAQAFSWRPDHNDAGVYTATFTVTDTGSPPLSDSKDVVITVTDVDVTAPRAVQNLRVVNEP